MVLRIVAILALVFTLGLTQSEPAFAHRDHDRETSVQAPDQRGETADALATNEHGTHASSEAGVQTPTEQSLMTRLIDWLGRTHPMLVHFPIALFPVGLLAAVLARRREDWKPVTRPVIGLAGFMTIPAALFGWFAGGLDLGADDSLLLVHRWLGTAIALFGIYFLIMAWKRKDWVFGGAAIGLLIALNAMLIVQGWFGGALVHGADHLSF